MLLEERLKYPNVGQSHKWAMERFKADRFHKIGRGEQMTDTRSNKKQTKHGIGKLTRSAPKTIRKIESRPAVKPKETVEIVIKKQLLGEAPIEKHFIVTDGKKLKNVKELIDSLEIMNDDTFMFHANEFKNDFAVWLRDVFSHENLAREMEKVKHRLEAQRVLMKRLMDDIEKAAK